LVLAVSGSISNRSLLATMEARQRSSGRPGTILVFDNSLRYSQRWPTESGRSAWCEGREHPDSYSRFLACRVLGSSEQAHEVVESCKVTASRNPPTFEYEGAFRSWLVRILIDEALAIVRQREQHDQRRKHEEPGSPEVAFREI
jgi:hypothetical protein